MAYEQYELACIIATLFSDRHLSIFSAQLSLALGNQGGVEDIGTDVSTTDSYLTQHKVLGSYDKLQAE